MSDISLENVASELQAIKWLLTILVVLAFLFFLFVFAILKGIKDQNSTLGRQYQNRKRQVELEELLAKGDATAVKFAAIEWVSSQPGEPYAHWFLAKAYYKLGALIDARKTFTHLQSIAPDWEKVVTPWIERIESEISPKVVK